MACDGRPFQTVCTNFSVGDVRRQWLRPVRDGRLDGIIYTSFSVEYPKDVTGGAQNCRLRTHLVERRISCALYRLALR